MMAKKIDMGETYDNSPTVASKTTKYYPCITVPVKVSGDMIGKRIVLLVEGKVVTVRASTGSGKQSKSSVDIEVHSIRMPKGKAGGASARYVESWMQEMSK